MLKIRRNCEFEVYGGRVKKVWRQLETWACVSREQSDTPQLLGRRKPDREKAAPKGGLSSVRFLTVYRFWCGNSFLRIGPNNPSAPVPSRSKLEGSGVVATTVVVPACT